MFQVNRVSALWEIFYRGTNRVLVCHMLDIAFHIWSLVRFDVHPQRVCPAKKL